MDYADRMQKPITAISEEFIAALGVILGRATSGKLQNFIERFRNSLDRRCAEWFAARTHHTTADDSKGLKPVTLEQAERSHILDAVLQTEGVIGGRMVASRPAGPAADDLDRQDEAPWVLVLFKGHPRRREQPSRRHELHLREGAELRCASASPISPTRRPRYVASTPGPKGTIRRSSSRGMYCATAMTVVPRR